MDRPGISRGALFFAGSPGFSEAYQTLQVTDLEMDAFLRLQEGFGAHGSGRK